MQQADQPAGTEAYLLAGAQDGRLLMIRKQHDQEATAPGAIAGSSKHELHPEPPWVQSCWTTSLWRGRNGFSAVRNVFELRR